MVACKLLAYIFPWRQEIEDKVAEGSKEEVFLRRKEKSNGGERNNDLSLFLFICLVSLLQF